MLEREETQDARGRGHLGMHPIYLQFITPNGTMLYMLRIAPYRLSFRLPTVSTGVPAICTLPPASHAAITSSAAALPSRGIKLTC